MVAVNRLYRKAIDTAIGAIVTKSFTKSVIGIWCATAASGVFSWFINKIFDYFK